ncbi:MAG TPA: TetR/AcrR family transcriptional regulator [Solirubrobacteraceae bacterium]|nr:TetR/AcrR family transcriptional regulator [Solirubrobacteraceae bacterium]
MDRPAAEPLAPLYERLPRGPHQLGADAVAENQRQRMYGAMIEAVATRGYGRTSVKQVVTLAGVSRRAFYEQFANKQECFLATLDLIASRTLAHIASAYGVSDGTLERRLAVALDRFAEIVCANPKGSRVMLVDAPSAGPAGWERLTRTVTAFEQRLAASFAHASDSATLPEPVARAIVGGLRRATFVRLLEGRAEELPELSKHMLSWTLVFRTESPVRFGGGRARPVAPENVRPREDDSGRVFNSALELAVLEGSANLTPMRIADEAGVSIDTFFSLCENVESCFLLAVERLAQEVRATVSDPGLDGPQWPYAVRRALDALLHYFAARPANAQTIATGVFAMGQRAIDLSTRLAREVAERLTAGAPGEPLTALAQEGIEGAIWHTIYSQTAQGGTASLPELTDYLAYVVIAPYLGAEEAARLVAEARAPRAA